MAGHTPDASTFHRVFCRLDVFAFERIVGEWIQEVEFILTYMLFLENAMTLRKEVKVWLTQHRGLKGKVYPPFSPNLNLIERLWKFFYEKVLANRYYETFAQFRKAIFEFFDNLSCYQKELSILLTDSFQLVPSVKLQT